MVRVSRWSMILLRPQKSKSGRYSLARIGERNMPMPRNTSHGAFRYDNFRLQSTESQYHKLLTLERPKRI